MIHIQNSDGIIICCDCHGLMECELEKYLVTIFLLVILNGSLSPFAMDMVFLSFIKALNIDVFYFEHRTYHLIE